MLVHFAGHDPFRPPLMYRPTSGFILAGQQAWRGYSYYANAFLGYPMKQP